MDSDGHLLVSGGPGSGKTTVSILKAAQIAEHELQPQQAVLFLSFARASISRVIEVIEQEQGIPRETKRRITVETYHSFFWRFLKTHGYLIGLPRRLDILASPAEAVALSAIRNQFKREEKERKTSAEDTERLRLASQEGRICFDLFAPFVGDLLHGSKRLRQLLATRYPAIILDEFQDTNAEQWHVVQALGKYSRLMALADPEQRIYGFAGADPERLNHFRDVFSPTEVDLGNANHRSARTDIVKFGNAILQGKFEQSTYDGIECILFEPYLDLAITKLVTTIYAARRRLVGSETPIWSLAILVPTKKMTRLVSEKLREPPRGLQSISHSAVIELESAILGAEIVAQLLQPNAVDHVEVFVNLLCNYFRGKGGDRPSKSALRKAASLSKAYEKWCAARDAGREPRSNSILVKTFAVRDTVRAIEFTGNPDKDWCAIRKALENGVCRHLQEIGTEIRNLRLLERGTQLRQDLAQDWRNNGCYTNALKIVQRAFAQEHFATSTKPEHGIVVMNMHKAKGKQFDEVILFEGWPIWKNGKMVANPDRIVRNNDDHTESKDGLCQKRQNFRVSVTRSRQRTTIFTPKNDPCVLLPRVRIGLPNTICTE